MISSLYLLYLFKFNDVLSGSGHNIKRYKNRQGMKKSQKLMPFTTSASNDRVLALTIDTSERIRDQQSNEKIKFNLERVGSRRISVTAQNSRRKHRQIAKGYTKIQHINKTIDIMDYQQASKQKQKKQNNYSINQKRFNKGPLKDKHIEAWLNTILMEVCTDQQFDISTQNPALKKYSIDRNSLLSKGMAISNLNRIYKSLFVYSIGFNELLQQLCRSNRSLRKTIWKVYAVLLQYCAQGDFEAMIAQIQRDKQQKVANLREQIQKRQEVIQMNEQINQQKNAKVYKQFKNLKQQNQNLRMQKQVLLEQYKQAEQAFNQEVTVRLKYQNRINQIHGVYTEIQNKHQRLRRDYQKVNNMYEIANAKNQKNIKKITQLNHEISVKDQMITKLDHQLFYCKQSIKDVEITKNNGANVNIAYGNRVKDLQKIIEEQTRIVSQQKFNNNNIKLLLQSSQGQNHRIRQEYDRSIQQNSRLHETIQDQMKNLNTLMLEKRAFGNSTKQFKAEITIAQNKLSLKIDECRQKIKIIQQKQEKYLKLQSIFTGEKRYRKQIQQDLKICYQKIDNMKQVKNAMQQQFQTKKKQIQIIDEIIEQKKQVISQLKQKNAHLQQKNADLNRQVKTANSKYHILQETSQANQQLSIRRYTDIKRQKQLIEQQYVQFDTIRKLLEMQLQKYKKIYSDSDSKLKNQLFEHNNLNLRYKQSLNVMEQQNTHIKQLNIKISEMKQEIYAQGRKNKNLTFVNQQMSRQFKKQKSFLEKHISTLSIQSGEKKSYIHPMFYEDLLGSYQNISVKYTQLLEVSTKNLKQLKKQNQQLKKQLKKKETLFDITVNKMNLENQKVIDKKNNENAYEQQKATHLAEKNKQLQEDLMFYIEGGKYRLANQTQQKYIKKIAQAQQKIQSLFTQLQSSHDANSNLLQNFKEYDKKIGENQSYIQKIKKLNQMILELQANVQKEKEKNLQMERKMEEDKLDRKEKTSREGSAQERNRKKKVESGRNNRSIHSGSKDSKHKYQSINWKNQDHSDNKRDEFVRKYKGAFIYYNNNNNNTNNNTNNNISNSNNSRNNSNK